MARLEVRNLVKVYKGRTVVNRVSFVVQSGETVGLLGRNGAGKTTSFRMAMGMARPKSGMVLMDGRNITSLPMYKRAKLGLGYLAQEPAVFEKLTVEHNLVGILEMRGLKGKALWEKVDALLTEFGLLLVRNSKAGSLSGGERRRLEIARALSTDPEIMLLDEPIYGVDPIAVSEILALIRDLKGRGYGILITEHNVEKVLPILDRVYIIHEGRVISQGTPDEIVANQLVREFYLGKDFEIPESALRAKPAQLTSAESAWSRSSEQPEEAPSPPAAPQSSKRVRVLARHTSRIPAGPALQTPPAEPTPPKRQTGKILSDSGRHPIAPPGRHDIDDDPIAGQPRDANR